MGWRSLKTEEIRVRQRAAEPRSSANVAVDLPGANPAWPAPRTSNAQSFALQQQLCDSPKSMVAKRSRPFYRPTHCEQLNRSLKAGDERVMRLQFVYLLLIRDYSDDGCGVDRSWCSTEAALQVSVLLHVAPVGEMRGRCDVEHYKIFVPVT